MGEIKDRRDLESYVMEFPLNRRRLERARKVTTVLTGQIRELQDFLQEHERVEVVSLKEQAIPSDIQQLLYDYLSFISKLWQYEDSPEGRALLPNLYSAEYAYLKHWAWRIKELDIYRVEIIDDSLVIEFELGLSKKQDSIKKNIAIPMAYFEDADGYKEAAYKAADIRNAHYEQDRFLHRSLERVESLLVRAGIENPTVILTSTGILLDAHDFNLKVASLDRKKLGKRFFPYEILSAFFAYAKNSNKKLAENDVQNSVIKPLEKVNPQLALDISVIVVGVSF